MLRYRVFSEADFAALQALDLEVQRRAAPTFGSLEEREREGRLRTSLPALKFFERSEHSFLAEDAQILEGQAPEGQAPGGRTLQGVILAQPVWQGDRPTVLVVQVLLAEHAPPETASGLLHACVKSAYDTAVYEVHFALTPELEAAAAAEEAHLAGRYAVRHLGSRHDTAPGLRLDSVPGTVSGALRTDE
ncbi:DUF1999 domain-containing protein [Deinococcus sp.]|uniref:DUF1999 domain-containing protein n=1 Tax=Deinococcus sp. TaxID=47478 RepID=UPI0025D8AF51|nr:DUF1999 domain-containing protein [Deinococcus sp.]